MARKLRIQYPGAIYHVMSRGDHREEIFAEGFTATLDTHSVDFTDEESGGDFDTGNPLCGDTPNWQRHDFYFSDANGNITALVDTNQSLSAQYRYDPFGNTISKSGTLSDANVHRFSSKEIHLASGMYYYGFRFYDTSLQRWLNRDPRQEIGGFNLYAYAKDDPIDRIDPLGWSDFNAPPGSVTGPGPLLPGPGQVPPGYNPSWPTGIGDPQAGERPFPYVQDPNTGRKYWPDPETPRQWPHYNWKDPNGKSGHFPEKCDKPWPNQEQPPYGPQSRDNPWPKPPEPPPKPPFPWWEIPLRIPGEIFFPFFIGPAQLYTDPNGMA